MKRGRVDAAENFAHLMKGLESLCLVRVQSSNTKDDCKHGSHMATP